MTSYVVGYIFNCLLKLVVRLLLFIIMSNSFSNIGHDCSAAVHTIMHIITYFYVPFNK